MLMLFSLESLNTGLWESGLDLGPISDSQPCLTSPSILKKA